MCQNKIFAPNVSSTGVQINRASGVASALSFTLPILRQNDGGNYIEFYAFDPEKGKLRRKRIKLNRIKGINNRKEYARNVIKRLVNQLNHGWNPWIAKDTSDLMLFEDAVKRYENHVEKMMASDCGSTYNNAIII